MEAVVKRVGVTRHPCWSLAMSTLIEMILRRVYGTNAGTCSLSRQEKVHPLADLRTEWEVYREDV